MNNGERAVGETAAELPVLHGYYREHLFMDAREKADIRARMLRTADHHGYRLGKIFEEKVETSPAALRALLDAALTDGAAVVLPGIQHLAIHGDPVKLRRHIADAIARDVLIAENY
ncbi:hypothetical protein [Kribbella sp. NPDC050470]|uniref:hypothetical protein n=1 Tax=unclassified Kribbella TaxID=2644121 RepID=UPI003798F98E